MSLWCRRLVAREQSRLDTHDTQRIVMSYGGWVVQVSVQDLDGSLILFYGAKWGPSRVELDIDEFGGVKMDIWGPVWGIDQVH